MLSTPWPTFHHHRTFYKSPTWGMGKNSKDPDKSCRASILIILSSLFTSPLPVHTPCEALHMLQLISIHLNLLNQEFLTLISGRAGPKAYGLLCRTFWPTLPPIHKPCCCSRLSMPLAHGSQLPNESHPPNPHHWSQLGGPTWAPTPSRAALTNSNPEGGPHPKMNTEESFLNSSRI